MLISFYLRREKNLPKKYVDKFLSKKGDLENGCEQGTD